MASSQVRPKILIRPGRAGEPLRIPIVDLVVDPIAKTYLDADTASASGTLTVKNIAAFAINQILLIGEPGNQSSEIIKTHASTAPSGTTITLAANTAQAHSAGTPVYAILYDQVEISQAATLAGAKTVLTTASLTADQLETTYNDTSISTGYYFARFKNSIGSTFSDYCTGVPYGGFGLTTARYIIDTAIRGIGKRIDSILLTDSTAFAELNNCQTEILKEQKRWAFMQNFNKSIGTATQGTWRITLPTDMDDQYTNKSVWHLRIAQDPDMQWVDKDKWDELTDQVVNTTLGATLNVSDTTITLTSSADFSASGSVLIGSVTYAYTANNTSTGVLTLSSAVASGQNQSNGAQVFQNAATGQPLYFTVFGGYFYHYPLVDSTRNGRNYYADYYKSQTIIADDGDAIVVPDHTACVYYLRSKFLELLNNGKPTQESEAQYAKFLQRKNNIKAKDSIGRTYRLRPVKNEINEKSWYGNDPKWIRIGNWINW